MKTTTQKMFTATVKTHEDVIFVKPVCDFFQINYLNQCRVIQKHPLLQTSHTKKYDKLLFGDERERVTLTKEAFITWILQLNTQIIHVSLRDKLIEYQTNILGFMFGTVKNKEQISIVYARQKKLRSLYGKIGSEIQICEKEIKGWMDGTFNQLAIFDQQNKIE